MAADVVALVTFEDDGRCGAIDGSGTVYNLYRNPDFPGLLAADVNNDGQILCEPNRRGVRDIFIADNLNSLGSRSMFGLRSICEDRDGWQRTGGTITESKLLGLLECRVLGYKEPSLSDKIGQLWPLGLFVAGALFTVVGLFFNTRADRQFLKIDILAPHAEKVWKRISRVQVASKTVIVIGVIGLVVGGVALADQMMKNRD
ncbi:MAG: hypothetical protein HYT76_09385 [Deltaproteobacteria bacterium]|nr:hypothetical protein [Deltaproteobacteria bacterium]